MATLAMVQLHPAFNSTGRVTSALPNVTPLSGIATGKSIPFVTYRDGHVVVVVVVVTGVVEVVVVVVVV